MFSQPGILSLDRWCLSLIIKRGDELLPLASTELDQRLISSVTVLMACLGQLQEGMGVNRAAAANAADLAQEVSAHFKTAVTAMTQRLEELERKG